jgi:hypothetical protein
MAGQTVDPTQSSKASQIPPAGAVHVGRSARGSVDVYCGTLPGDVDAQPAAKELLGSGPDTGQLSNADYIYSRMAALYGMDLPALRDAGAQDVKTLVFVSGSAQGPYGAFHFPGAQEDLDRIVVDSLESSGTYAGSSGLGASFPSGVLRIPHAVQGGMGPHSAAFHGGMGPHSAEAYGGPHGLLYVTDPADPRLVQATVEEIREAGALAARSILALRAAVEAQSLSAKPPTAGLHRQNGSSREELARELIAANHEILRLLRTVRVATGGRQYLSTALFAAELAESFEVLSKTAAPGKTDGEAVSRVLAYKLTPEISLIPGFNGAQSQQWWQKGHPDFVNSNSQSDTSAEGNGAGVLFLLFLNDFLGVSLDQVIQHMPPAGGAPLGHTYVNLLADYPALASVAGADGASAFKTMIALLEQNATDASGALNLPANGNPFPGMPGARQGGLFDPGKSGKSKQAG